MRTAASADSATTADALRRINEARERVTTGKAVVKGKGKKALHVGILQRNVESLQADAGIPGGAVNLGNLRAAAQGFDDGVLPATAADHEHRFSQTIFQPDFLAPCGGLQGRERIDKTHTTTNV